uniref:hypothetical protein n=1 Tax=Roseivirga sp. TaxID=1964215 RepID=UPI004048C26F
MRKFLFSIMALLLVLGTATASFPSEEPNDRVNVDVSLQVDNFEIQDAVQVVDLMGRDVYQIEQVNALPTARVIEGYSAYFGIVNDVGKGPKRITLHFTIEKARGDILKVQEISSNLLINRISLYLKFLGID